MGKIGRLTAWGLAASPAFLPLILILHFGVNVHFLDEWSPTLAGFFVKFHQHKVTFHDFVAQNNEHRILIPRLVYLLLNELTDWNNIQTLIAGWGIVFCTSLLILSLIRRTAGDSGAAALWFVCNVLLFSSMQVETWMWGILIVNVIPALLILLAFRIAASGPATPMRLSLCILLASMATFSSGNGLLAWPLVGLILFFSKSAGASEKKWKRVAIWIAAFGVNIALYAIGYVRPAEGHSAIAHSVSDIFYYNLEFAGNAFAGAANFPAESAAIFVGSVFLLIFLAAVGFFLLQWKRGDREACDGMLIWIAVGLFGIFSGLIASIFRAGFGPQQAMSSRYVTYSVYLPISLVILVPMILRRRGAPAKAWPMQATAVLATILVCGQFVSLPIALADFRAMSQSRREDKAALLMIDVLPNNSRLAEPISVNPQLRETVDSLNDMGYIQPPLIGTSRADLIQESGDAVGITGSLNTIGKIGGNEYSVRGTALNTGDQRPVDGVFLTYNDGISGPVIFASAHLQRRGAAALQGSTESNVVLGGWSADFSASDIPPGLKNVRIAAWVLDTETGKMIPLSGTVPLDY
jgi:hypothetical protein